MPLATALATTLYFQVQSGELAGMDNTILKPKATLGVRTDGVISYGGIPWVVDGDAKLIFGKTLTGTSVSASDAREFRATGEVLYNYYQEEGERISVGPYVDLALPFHSATPYILQTESGNYSAEEGDVLHTQHLIGCDLRLDASGRKLQSSLRNVLFVNGTKIGPNLSSYQPLLGLLWTNSYTVLGTVDRPRLTFHLESDFYLAQKNSAGLFNGHDGLGGTKRELDIDFGVRWQFMHNTALTLDTWGTNNLNRGTSTTVPIDFRDGFTLGIEYTF